MTDGDFQEEQTLEEKVKSLEKFLVKQIEWLSSRIEKLEKRFARRECRRVGPSPDLPRSLPGPKISKKVRDQIKDIWDRRPK